MGEAGRFLASGAWVEGVSDEGLDGGGKPVLMGARDAAGEVVAWVGAVGYG